MEVATEKIRISKYPAYKDSGVEWLGEIPEHWDAVSLGSIMELKSDKNHPDYEVLSVYREYGVIKKDSRDDNHNVTSENTTNYKAVEPGDLVVNKMKAWQGSMGISPYKGIVSPAYITCKITSKNIYSEFLHRLLRCNSYIIEYIRISYGVRVGQWDMHFEDFKRVTVLVPPLEEQTAIANFLDRKTTLIDQAIGIKQKQIELLKERRQILIHKAVTRGLNPNVKMKDSGVEWIGEIPEGWEVTKLCFLTFKIGDGLHGTPNYTDNTDFHFINGNNLSTGYIEITEQTKTVSEREYNLHKKDLTKNTLLLSINGTIGNVAFYRGETVMLGKSAAYLNFYSEVNINYIKCFLDSLVFKNYYELQLSGSTINNFSLYSIGKTPIVLPSSSEQKNIVEYITSASTKIASAISLKEKEIEKLKEYKATLINSAVTGKIKVC